MKVDENICGATCISGATCCRHATCISDATCCRHATCISDATCCRHATCISDAIFYMLHASLLPFLTLFLPPGSVQGMLGGLKWMKISLVLHSSLMLCDAIFKTFLDTRLCARRDAWSPVSRSATSFLTSVLLLNLLSVSYCYSIYCK